MLECVAEYNAFKATLKCARCPEDDFATLDFHHLDPSTKERNIATAARSWTPDRLKTEIAKCIVLCSNCHRKLHYYEKR